MSIKTCPITKRPMECLECELPDNAFCPYIAFDKLVEKTLTFCRKLTDKEKHDKK